MDTPLENVGFFLARYSTMPMNRVVEWTHATAADIDTNRTPGVSFLRETFASGFASDALRLASRDLFDQLSGGEGLTLGAARSLASYFARMCSRATPFGLFAGTTVGVIGSRLDLTAPEPDAWVRSVRIDGGFLSDICERIEADREARPDLHYRLNSSCYRVGSEWRYYTHTTPSRVRVFHLEAVRGNPYLDQLLVKARNTYVGFAELRDLLTSFGAGSSESNEFLHQVLDAQLLTSNIRPPLTGGDPLDYVISVVDQFSSQRQAYLPTLLELRRGVTSARGPLTDGVSVAVTAEMLRQASTHVGVHAPRDVLQVDLYAPDHSPSLDEQSVASIASGVEVLRRLGSSDTLAQQSYRYLREFIDAFVKRYGEREVPLTLVLDQESGIGWNGRAQEDLQTSDAIIALEREVPRLQQEVSRRDVLLWQLAVDSDPEPGKDFEMSTETIERIGKNSRVALPERSQMATVTIGNRASGGPVIYVAEAWGGLGAMFFGRFCNSDPELTQRVLAYIREEETAEPDVVFAELVYAARGRIANIAARPQLRAHEIHCMANGAAGPPYRWTIADLTVCVRNGRVLLRHGESRRQVIPRFSSAQDSLSYFHIPAHRFLYLLQWQDAWHVGWTWGELAAGLPYLPRVTWRNLVLSLASWRLPGDDLRALEGTRLPTRRVESMRGMRDRLGMPRFVTISEGDQRLLIDTENVLSIEVLLHHAHKRELVRVSECFPEPEREVLDGQQLGQRHQFFVPFICRSAPRLAYGKKLFARKAGLPEQFSPGSEWLYARVYASPATADRLLLEAVAPLVTELESRDMVSCWFFVRYRDPRAHLRIRLRLRGEGLFGDAIAMLRASFDPWVREGYIAGWNIDSYMPEVERYGGEGTMAECERMFCCDSRSVLACVRALTDIRDRDARWLVGVLGVEGLLNAFGLSDEERVRLMRNMYRWYGDGDDYLSGRQNRKLMAKLHRQFGDVVVGLLNAEGNSPAWAGEAAAILRERDVTIAEGARRVQEAAMSLTSPLADIWGSCIHMHMNRLIPDDQRRHEFLVYSLLHRYHVARVKRSLSMQG